MAETTPKILDLIPVERAKQLLRRASENLRAALVLLDREGSPLLDSGQDSGPTGLSPDELRRYRDWISPLLQHRTPPSLHRHPTDSLYAAPLQCRDETLGLLLLRFGDARSSDQNERDARILQEHLQDLLSAGYELYNLSSEIVRNYEELALLYDLSLKLSAQTDIQRICEIVADQVQSVLPSKNLAVLRVDQRTGALRSEIAIRHDGYRYPSIQIGPGEGIVGQVALTGRPRIASPLEPDPGLARTGYPIEALLCVPITLGRKTLGVILVGDKRDGQEFTTFDQKLVLAIAAEAAAALENAHLIQEIKDLFLSTVKSLVMAIDAKDPYTHLHSLRVSEVSTILAEELGLPRSDVEQIKLAALLHDVGKIGVPEHVLLKPDKLTHDEWDAMKQHPLHSVQILEQVKQFTHLAKWVRHEHEHYDGSGYPDQLKGDAIPLPSRIIAVADAFDAITSDRYYRKGRSEAIAFRIIQDASGSQFDPEVARAFATAYEKGRLKGLPT